MLHGRNRIVDEMIEIDDGHSSIMSDIFNRTSKNKIKDDCTKLENIAKKYKKIFKQSPCMDTGQHFCKEQK